MCVCVCVCVCVCACVCVCVCACVCACVCVLHESERGGGKFKFIVMTSSKLSSEHNNKEKYRIGNTHANYMYETHRRILFDTIPLHYQCAGCLL